MAEHFYEVRAIGNTISVYGELSLRSLPYLASKLHHVTRIAGYRDVTSDFRNLTGIYPSVGPGLASLAQYLRQEYKVDFYFVEPEIPQVRQRFRVSGINYHLDPSKGNRLFRNSSESQILPFRSSDQQHDVVDKILNNTLRKVELARPQLKAVEWALSEITDNVLNHSGSKVGGYAIASKIPNTNIVEFCVADSGIGIADSLGESDHCRALELAIQEGVTRNKQTNQGNGLYGTFRLA